jgi:heat shock protein HtpX
MAKSQNLLPLVAMAVILAICGWIVAGLFGAIGVLIGVTVLVVVGPQVSPELAMRVGHAIPLDPWQAPAPYHDVEQLARLYGLANVPRLYLVTQEVPVVFSSGNRRHSAIAVSTAALSVLSERELRAVLAHEMAHIAADDIGLMRVANILGRITSFIATFGLFAILFGIMLPKGAMATEVIWFLALAPTSVSLLQLAILRRREYAADAAAAAHSGDPAALAEALVKIERATRFTLKRMFGEAAAVELPTLLRTHPTTEDRVARLTGKTPGGGAGEGDGG